MDEYLKIKKNNELNNINITVIRVIEEVHFLVVEEKNVEITGENLDAIQLIMLVGYLKVLSHG